MTTPGGKLRKRQEYVDVDVVASAANRIPPERLKGYKPFKGFPKQSSATDTPSTTDAPSADDKPAA